MCAKQNVMRVWNGKPSITYNFIPTFGYPPSQYYRLRLSTLSARSHANWKAGQVPMLVEALLLESRAWLGRSLSLLPNINWILSLCWAFPGLHTQSYRLPTNNGILSLRCARANSCLAWNFERTHYAGARTGILQGTSSVQLSSDYALQTLKSCACGHHNDDDPIFWTCQIELSLDTICIWRWVHCSYPEFP